MLKGDALKEKMRGKKVRLASRIGSGVCAALAVLLAGTGIWQASATADPEYGSASEAAAAVIAAGDYSDDEDEWFKYNTDQADSYEDDAGLRTYKFTTASGDVYFVTKEHGVTFDSRGGTEVASQSVDDGLYATEPTDPTKEGAEFEGWYLASGLATASAKSSWLRTASAKSMFSFGTPITSDITLAAAWSDDDDDPVYYTVTFDSNGGSDVASQQVMEGYTAVKPDDPTRDGYDFVCWNLSGTEYNFSAEVHSDITLVAQWQEQEEPDEPDEPDDPDEPDEPDEPEPTPEPTPDPDPDPEEPTEPDAAYYVVSFDSNGGTDVDSQVVEEGHSATMPSPDPTRDGYSFTCWVLDGAEYDFSSPVYEDITLIAQWQEDEEPEPDPEPTPDPDPDPAPACYTVTFDSDGGTEVDPQTVGEGGKATEPDDPTKDGYVFAGWTYRGEAFDFDTAIYSDITLVAKWTGKDKGARFPTKTGDSVPWMGWAAAALGALAVLLGVLGWRRRPQDGR